MTHATPIFRLLAVPIDDKGDALRALVREVNDAIRNTQYEDIPYSVLRKEAGGEVFAVDPADFGQIPGSPFAYWVGDSIRQLFTKLSTVDDQSDVRQGLATTDDFRFVRTWWEIPISNFAYSADQASKKQCWVHFAKGGAYSLYYDDVHLTVDWGYEGERIKESICRKYPYLKEKWEWVAKNVRYYFRPGLTWPRRTQKGFNLRAMPGGCIFADKGPVVFIPDNQSDVLLAMLAIMNSQLFKALLQLQMAFGSYEVGVIQRTPIPDLRNTEYAIRTALSTLALEAHDLQRDRDRDDETTHAFCLPGLVRHRDAPTLLAAGLRLDAESQTRAARLAAIQTDIDDLVFDLYGLTPADRALVRREMGERESESANERES